MNERLAIVVIFSAVFIRELWTLLPNSDLTYTPFPFSDQEITKQTYVAYGCYYASTLMLSYAIGLLVKTFHDVVKIWFLLQFIEFIDYFLTYNTAWFQFLGFAVGITIIKFTVLSLSIIYKIYICRI